MGNFIRIPIFIGIPNRQGMSCLFYRIRINNQNAMNMIGHHDKFAQGDIFGVVFYFVPKDIGQYTNIGQFHFVFEDLSKIMCSIFCADGYKIGTLLAIIPGLQTCGRNAVFILKFISHFLWSIISFKAITLFRIYQPNLLTSILNNSAAFFHIINSFLSSSNSNWSINRR